MVSGQGTKRCQYIHKTTINNAYMNVYINECYCVPLSSSWSSIIWYDKQFHQSSQNYRIQTSCEDYCCRRSNLIRKSINSATYDYRRADRCELSKVIIALMRTEMWSLRYYSSIKSLFWCNGLLFVYFFFHSRKQTEMSSSAGGGSLKLVPFIVQIFSSKSKTPICLGSLIHPHIVMTTLVCASM